MRILYSTSLVTANCFPGFRLRINSIIVMYFRRLPWYFLDL
jgi:hypothetical protein